MLFSTNTKNIRKDLQLKSIDLLCNVILKPKFKSIRVPEVCKFLGNYSKKLQNNLSVFGSSCM